jgi:hypothetical protein
MATLAGVVSDPVGPAGGIDVEVTKVSQDGPAGASGIPRTRHASTDSEGRYRIEGLLPGQYEVQYGKPNAPVKHEDTVAVASGQREVQKDLVVHGSRVTIAVRSARGGTPLRRAEVEIRRVEDPSRPRPQRPRLIGVSMSVEGDGNSGESTTSMSIGQTSVQTDAEGKAVLEGIPPGRYEVQVEYPEHASFLTPPFELGPDTASDLGSVKLVAGGAIGGEVKMRPLADGEPFPLVQIAPADGKPPLWQQVPAPNGKFRKTGLAPGSYRLRASNPAIGSGSGDQRHGPEVTTEVVAGATSKVTLELPR